MAETDMPDEIYLQFSNDGTQIRHWSRKAPESVKAMCKYIRADLAQTPAPDGDLSQPDALPYVPLTTGYNTDDGGALDAVIELMNKKYNAAKKTPIILSWDDANSIIEALDNKRAALTAKQAPELSIAGDDKVVFTWKCNCCHTKFQSTQHDRTDDGLGNGGAKCPRCKAEGQYTYRYHSSNPLEDLKAVLCAPEGKCCISGSDADRKIIDNALSDLSISAAPKAVEDIPPLCHQVDFGTYKNSVGLMAPWGELVTVDICMIPEIKWLWNKGIKTIECCCGHGNELPYIAVTEGNRQTMEELGYTPDPRSPSCYLAKSKSDTPTPPNVTKQLVEALEVARKRIAYLGTITSQIHELCNEQVFLPQIDEALAAAEKEWV